MKNQITVGTVLVANEDAFTKDASKEKFLTKGKEYPVGDVIPRYIIIIDDGGITHYFTMKDVAKMFTIKKPEPQRLMGKQDFIKSLIDSKDNIHEDWKYDVECYLDNNKEMFSVSEILSIMNRIVN